MEQTYRKLAFIGLLVVLLLLNFIIFYQYLKGKNLFRDDHYYHVLFAGVDGLYKSNQVLVNGMRVGQVSAIDFADDSTGRILVTLRIPASRSIAATASAQIVNTGLIGGRVIRLNHATGPGPYLHDGDTIRGNTDRSYADVVETDIQPVISNADTLLPLLKRIAFTLNEAITPETATLIQGTLQNIHTASANLNTTLAQLPPMVADARRAMQSIQELSTGGRQTLTQANRLLDTLQYANLGLIAHRADSTLQSLNSLLAALQSTQGTAGRLINSPELYNHLDSATRNLELLLRDLKEHPKRYVHFSLF
jgi:mammalian cell entry related domain protein